jgi:hypothetical protein
LPSLLVEKAKHFEVLEEQEMEIVVTLVTALEELMRILILRY